MRASIQDVARRANVSAMTVSNVLRRRPGSVSEATRLRVLEALQELNYIPVRLASQNRHTETNAIGVIFLQDMQGFVGEQTFWGMSARAGKRPGSARHPAVQAGVDGTGRLRAVPRPSL